MWAHIVHTVLHWAWGIIASFAASAAALWIAHSETRERRQLLACRAVVDVHASALHWHKEATVFVRDVRRSLQGEVSDDVVKDAFNQELTAAGAMARVLTNARLLCNDFELQVRIAEAESELVEFMGLIEVSPAESAEQHRAVRSKLVEDGPTVLSNFSDATDAFVKRGLDIYSPRRGPRYRLAKWRWDRQAK